MIQIQNVTKKFGNITVVDDLSFSIQQGQIFGILGPNGAGKTTLMRMLCGLLTPCSGAITIAGTSPQNSKEKFGYMSQHVGLYDELSVWENINFYATLYGIHDNQHLEFLLNRYELTSFKNHRFQTLSGGYKHRLGIACALVHNPQLLLLDEPTAGIDPLTRKRLWDDLYQLSAEGKTIIVTTHYMEEAQRCSQLLFLAKGKKLAEGTPETIKQSLGNVTIFSGQLPYLPALHTALLSLPEVVALNQFGEELRIIAAQSLPKEQLEQAIAPFVETHAPLSPSHLSLEDVFIGLTEQKAPV